jgi:predicted O-methyltransferase YrrM
MVTLGVSSEMLHFLNHNVSRDSHTLETGAGISTILFALKQTFHTCVVPDAELVDRIKNYCHRNQISTAKISFQIGCSEAILPQLNPEPLDLVLIDGRHAFPSPFIDWYYTANHLKVGGIVIVDDTKIWTGEILQNFLKDEAEWQFKEAFPAASPNATAFVKLQPGSHAKWWAQQPYVMKHSPMAAVS